MYEFWYDYIKPKYQNNAQLRYMDTESLIIQTKTEDVYENISNWCSEKFDMMSVDHYLQERIRNLLD